ncbi:hypothetical protein IMZ48_05945 [Candidatus Bathyarchaeota archaeon]|nr:hypothetical protein [Candidatus Bathyarchaeota archaeon]
MEAMFVQPGNIFGSNTYREDDIPPPPEEGNSILLGISCFSIVLFWPVKLLYIWRDDVRDRKWGAIGTMVRGSMRSFWSTRRIRG